MLLSRVKYERRDILKCQGWHPAAGRRNFSLAERKKEKIPGGIFLMLGGKVVTLEQAVAQLVDCGSLLGEFLLQLPGCLDLFND